MFDYFANCEYFEKKFKYDEIIELPKGGDGEGGDNPPPPPPPSYVSTVNDIIVTSEETMVGPDGMKIDRMYFEKFEKTVVDHPILKAHAEQGKWDELVDYIEKNIMDKPDEFYTLDKLRASIHSDRRIPLREIVEKIFGIIPYFKTKNELLDEEFDRFDSRYLPKEEYFTYARTVFKAYILDPEFREIIDTGDFAHLNVSAYGEAFKRLSPELRKAIPEYIKDYVPLNNFVA